MRISARADYAIQALAYMAGADAREPVKAEVIAEAQRIPLKFLLGILRDLKNAHLLRSRRGAHGGYTLSRPATEITLADIIRPIDGPLANVRDQSLRNLVYTGAATSLPEVWMAVRASLRSVLDTVTIAHVASGVLPKRVREMAARYEADVREKS